MKHQNYQDLSKKNLGKLPVWNLKDLYHSPNSSILKNDLDNLRKSTKKFEKKI